MDAIDKVLCVQMINIGHLSCSICCFTWHVVHMRTHLCKANKACMERTLQVLHLQGIRQEPPKPYLAANMSRYGMGTVRSLADWERFAGIDLKSHQVPFSAAVLQ